MDSTAILPAEIVNHIMMLVCDDHDFHANIAAISKIYHEKCGLDPFLAREIKEDHDQAIRPNHPWHGELRNLWSVHMSDYSFWKITMRSRQRYLSATRLVYEHHITVRDIGEMKIVIVHSEEDSKAKPPGTARLIGIPCLITWSLDHGFSSPASAQIDHGSTLVADPPKLSHGAILLCKKTVGLLYPESDLSCFDTALSSLDAGSINGWPIDENGMAAGVWSRRSDGCHFVIPGRENDAIHYNIGEAEAMIHLMTFMAGSCTLRYSS